MNVSHKLNLFVLKGTEGDKIRRKAAAVAITIPVIVLAVAAIYIAVSANAPSASIISHPGYLHASPELMVAHRNDVASSLAASPAAHEIYPRTVSEMSMATSFRCQ